MQNVPVTSEVTGTQVQETRYLRLNQLFPGKQFSDLAAEKQDPSFTLCQLLEACYYTRLPVVPLWTTLKWEGILPQEFCRFCRLNSTNHSAISGLFLARRKRFRISNMLPELFNGPSLVPA